MKAATVMSVRDYALIRLGEKGTITVVRGPMLYKNIWRELDLAHINCGALGMAVDELCKEGLVEMQDGATTTSPGESAGIVRDVSRQQKCTYRLTDAGKDAYEALLHAVGKNDLS